MHETSSCVILKRLNKILCNIVSRKRAKYQISPTPHYCQKSKVYSKKCPPIDLVRKVLSSTWCKGSLYLHRKWCDIKHKYLLKVTVAASKKFWLAFLHYVLGLPVKFELRVVFLRKGRTLPLVHLCEATHACEMRTLNWIKLVLGGCVGVQYPAVGCDNVNMGTFSW